MTSFRFAGFDSIRDRLARKYTNKFFRPRSQRFFNIEKRVFVEGTHVRAGDVLFKIEGRSLVATYRARKADVANAVAASNLAKQILMRYQKLLKLGAVSRQEYDTNAACQCEHPIWTHIVIEYCPARVVILEPFVGFV